MSEVMEIDEEGDNARASVVRNYAIVFPQVDDASSSVIDQVGNESVRFESVNHINQQPSNSQSEVIQLNNETASNTAADGLSIGSQKSTISICGSSQDSSLCASPVKKKRSSEVLDEDEGCQTCPICFDNWTTTGDHRLCSLKCGHLFGYKCVKRWICLEAEPRCPTCKERTHLEDVRCLYARKIIAMDDFELTKTKKRLDQVNDEKNRLQTELAQSTCRMHMLREEVDDYKQRLSLIVQDRKGTCNYGSPVEVVTLYKEKTLDLGRDSSCRVLDTKSQLNMIAVSTYCMGFGARLINMTSFKPTAFILLHSQMIRDIKFHESKPWLLTCSTDKEIKILDINTNQVNMTFKAYSSLWSCCWDADNEQHLYVGQQQGSVLKYDMRKPTEPVQIFFVPGDYSPVVSVQSITTSSPYLPMGGVLSCKLTATWAFEDTPLGPERYFLPVEGPFVAMSFHRNHLFLSSRPNTRYPYARHFLCSLSKEGSNSIHCNIIHTFRGGNTQRMLARACLFSNKSDYAAAYIEDQHIVSIWNINNANKVGSVPARESVLDISNVKTSHADYLLTLTESKLRFFKFNN